VAFYSDFAIPLCSQSREELKMKHKAVLWTILYLLTFLYPHTCVHALQQDNESEKAILAIDNERDNALIERNLATLDRVLGDDLTYIHASGLLESKAEFLEDLKSNKRRYISIRNSDARVRMVNGVALITARSEIRVVHEGKESDLSLRVTEVYAKRKAKWQLIAYQSSRTTP
jgi:ketosteroid isomerase-like protein